jgi:ATP-dependent Clp protease ATP-binding subunit ClpC
MISHNEQVLSNRNNSRARSNRVIDRFGRNLNSLAGKGKINPCIGRNEELERIETILSKEKKRNPILVGDPGVGKSAIVEGLALIITQGTVNELLLNKEIIEIRLSDLIAGASIKGEFEERLKSIISDVVNSNGGIILFIDEIHTILGAGNEAGGLDAANILKPYLARGDFQCIGATTTAEYQKYFEKDGALSRRFQKINIDEPDSQTTKRILEGIKGRLEIFHNVQITDEQIDYIIKQAAQYLCYRKSPDREIDLLDESCAECRKDDDNNLDNNQITEIEEKKRVALESLDYEKASQYHKYLSKVKSSDRVQVRVINKKNVDKVLSIWSGIPVEHFTREFKEKIDSIDLNLKENVIGQDDARQAVVTSLRRSSLELNEKTRPRFTMFFAGPTGVGKTETARVLAENLFGSKDALIRFDMSEYQERHTVARLIGSPPGYVGYDEGGQLTNKVISKPYSLLVFDEVEKAHPDVFDIFLQIFEEGELTDGQGRKANFRNTMIIMTSNIRLRDKSDKVPGFNLVTKSSSSQESDPRTSLARVIKPEIVNRIDEVIEFQSITERSIKEIIKLHLKNFKTRLMIDKEVNLIYDDKLIDWLTQKTNYKTFGAREVKRDIQNYIIDKIAEEMILDDKLSNVQIDVSDNQIILKKTGNV